MSDINILSSLFSFSTALKIMLLKYYLPLILAKVDTSSMHNSVEARTPYLSPQFVSSCLTNTTINAKPSFFKYLLPPNIYKLLYAIPKEGFSPSASYKQSRIHSNKSSTASCRVTGLPNFTSFPLFDNFYPITLQYMPGLQLNSLFIIAFFMTNLIKSFNPTVFLLSIFFSASSLTLISVSSTIF